MDTEDFVIKRDGTTEPMSFDKILNRVKKLGDKQLNVNYTNLVQKIVDRLYDNIETTLIDELTAQQCASLSTTHLDYGVLASRIMISNHQKNTSSSFTEVMRDLYEFKDVNDDPSPLIHPKLWELVKEKSEVIEKYIDYDRDYLIDYFGFKKRFCFYAPVPALNIKIQKIFFWGGGQFAKQIFGIFTTLTPRIPEASLPPSPLYFGVLF